MGFAHALELAAGDDVEPCSLLGKQTENRQGGIGFDGVTDCMGPVSEDGFEELEAVRDLLRRIDVKRRSVLGGEGCEIDFVAVEGAGAIDERTGIGLGCCDLFRQT